MERRSNRRQKASIEKRLRELGLTEFSEQAAQAHSDVLGSYTGDPLYDEEPVQDADDL